MSDSTKPSDLSSSLWESDVDRALHEVLLPNGVLTNFHLRQNTDEYDMALLLVEKGFLKLTHTYEYHNEWRNSKHHGAILMGAFEITEQGRAWRTLSKV